MLLLMLSADLIGGTHPSTRSTHHRRDVLDWYCYAKEEKTLIVILSLMHTLKSSQQKRIQENPEYG